MHWKESEPGYQPQALAGTTFVLTGTLPTLKREEAAAMIEAATGGMPTLEPIASADQSVGRFDLTGH